MNVHKHIRKHNEHVKKICENCQSTISITAPRQLMQSAVNTAKLGMLTGIAGGIFGSMGKNSFGNTGAAVGGAMNLAAVGNLANICMSILPRQKKRRM